MRLRFARVSRYIFQKYNNAKSISTNIQFLNTISTGRRWQSLNQKISLISNEYPRDLLFSNAKPFGLFGLSGLCSPFLRIPGQKHSIHNKLSLLKLDKISANESLIKLLG